MVEETLNIVRGLQKQSAEPPKLDPMRYMVDSSPSSFPLGQYAALLALGAANQSAPHTLSGTSEDLAFFTRPLSEQLYGTGPQEPPPTVRPRKSNNPKEK